MRAFVAVILAMAILGIGFIAVGGQIDQADGSINDSDSSADAFNASVDVTEKLTLVQGAAIPLIGMAALAMLAVGVLGSVARRSR